MTLVLLTLWADIACLLVIAVVSFHQCGRCLYRAEKKRAAMFAMFGLALMPVAYLLWSAI